MLQTKIFSIPLENYLWATVSADMPASCASKILMKYLRMLYAFVNVFLKPIILISPITFSKLLIHIFDSWL